MIRFCCEHCGHKISVRDENAGKRGKCPKCSNFFVVPDKSATLEFRCRRCGQKISVPRIHSGKRGHCPKCKNPITVPTVERPVYKLKEEDFDETVPRLAGNDAGLTLLEVPEEYKLKDEHANGLRTVKTAIEQETGSEEEKATGEIDITNRCNLPWIIDIFLYPSSKAGLMTLSIIVLIPLFIRIFVGLLGKSSQQFTPMLVFFVPIRVAGFFVEVLLSMYLYWYFSECIHDSAVGGIRAPETMAHTPGLGDLMWQWFRTLVCLFVFIAPVLIYYQHTRRTDIIFWALLAYAIFFFPMALLAVVMFDSFSGLNPVLLIGSILSTFLPYSAMIVAFVTTGFLIVQNLPETNGSPVLVFILYCVSIYLLIVIAHLLGWFYYRYQDKLNWEV